MSDKLKGLLKYKFVFNIFHFAIKHLLHRKFNYHFEKVVPHNQPYIVLVNHNTDYDPLMVGVSFPRLLYYVASDHIFRWGFISKLIMFLVDPIPRMKAVTETETVKQILRRMKAGANVCIFAEGNRSFTGETGAIPESTGKLIKRSGVALITYRLDGGYFSSPRWSRTIRRGVMSGRKVREYSPEEIKNMTAAELNEAIKNDLYVNAYEEQRKHPIDYNGLKLAENLETALYLCPCCGNVATLKSQEDRFYCPCGLDLRYTSKGYFVSLDGNLPPFSTVADWSRWQSTRVTELVTNIKASAWDQPILSDKDQSLWLVNKARKSQFVGKGELYLYKDKISLVFEDGKEQTFCLDQISDMAIHGQMVLIFSTSDRKSYEIKSNHPRSALKYRDYYEILKANKGNENKTEE